MFLNKIYKKYTENKNLFSGLNASSAPSISSKSSIFSLNNFIHPLLFGLSGLSGLSRFLIAATALAALSVSISANAADAKTPQNLKSTQAVQSTQINKPIKIPEAGFDYRVVDVDPTTQAMLKKDKKIEVVEFFWYGCPHCFALEPHLKTWLEQNKTKINFKRVPVAFSQGAVFHQKLFYAIQTMHIFDKQHDAIFNQFHKKQQPINTLADLEIFAKTQKIDFNQLKNNIQSFSIATDIQKANQLVQVKKIDGVPSLMVDQKYITSSQMAGGRTEAIAVIDYLVNTSIKQKTNNIKK